MYSHSIFFFFLENMALIIALMFLGLKLKEFILQKIDNPLRYMWLSALFIGFLSFSIMFHPLLLEGMRLDLREVPLFFISYLGGWKLGVLSAILPGIFRFSLGGPTLIEGIVQGILLPVLIGALFHNKKVLNHPYTIINIKHMIIGFIVFEVIKTGLMLWTTPITFSITIAMFFFATVAILGIGLMLNDFNRNAMSRKELEFLSNYDSMTHLPNIRYFKNEVHKLISHKVPISICMFDVDYFKHYNDTNGHPAGDEVLRIIGQLLKESVEKGDMIARYGGEEFIICYSNVTSAEDVTATAETFRKKVEEYIFENEETQPNVDVTISIGVTIPSQNKTLDELIGQADKALYQSKQKGRNQVTIFKSSM
ncbi:diguanylate cyclase [Salipaludibacillus sp. CF4.18]|uniref:diguanylate cyclase n=1 Tax=Salipaludibacillus sp. CF4.18 TaxID=3373081 RepID=UPI003EE6C098